MIVSALCTLVGTLETRTKGPIGQYLDADFDKLTDGDFKALKMTKTDWVKAVLTSTADITSSSAGALLCYRYTPDIQFLQYGNIKYASTAVFAAIEALCLYGNIAAIRCDAANKTKQGLQFFTKSSKTLSTGQENALKVLGVVLTLLSQAIRTANQFPFLMAFMCKVLGPLTGFQASLQDILLFTAYFALPIAGSEFFNFSKKAENHLIMHAEKKGVENEKEIFGKWLGCACAAVDEYPDGTFDRVELKKGVNSVQAGTRISVPMLDFSRPVEHILDPRQDDEQIEQLRSALGEKDVQVTMKRI